MVGSYLSLQGAQKLIGMSDEYTQTNARLDLINDGLQTTSQLQDKIFASAQRSRASYTDMASAVAKLGLTANKAFKNNDEIVAFTELLNKNFVVGGAGAQEQAAAMYQLTQAMGSGKLQGDEYRSIIENAPLLARAIEDYMRNVQKAKGTMKEWAADGLLTADVIKAALFTSADEINRKFESIPMTWGQIWTQAMNSLYKASMPLLGFINKLAQNWDIIRPIVLGAAAAIGVYTAALVIGKAAMGIYSIMTAAHTALTSAWSFATFAQTAAQQGLNAALYACPLTWILMIIIAIIAVIFAVVAAINKVTGTTVSAVGVIMGSIFVAGAFIWNVIAGLINAIMAIIDTVANAIIGVVEWVLNVCNGGFNSFGDAVANLIGNIISWFLNLGTVVTTIIDAIFGTNWTGGLKSLASSVSNWGKNENAITLDRWDHSVDRIAYGDAYSKGYSMGEGMGKKVSGLFGGTNNALNDLSNLTTDVTGTDKSGSKAVKTTTNDDLFSDEDIQLLLDVATRDYKLNYQQITPNITLTFGDVHETADVDQLIDEVATKLEEIYDGNLEV